MPGIGADKVLGNGGIGMCDAIEPEEITKEEEMRWQIDHWKDMYYTSKEKIAYFVKNLPEMEIKEGCEDEWWRIVEVNQDDDYSKAVVDMTEMMAKALQAVRGCIANRDDLAYHVMCMIDSHGMTGFQAECVYSLLKKVWKYGEEFFKKGN